MKWAVLSISVCLLLSGCDFYDVGYERGLSGYKKDPVLLVFPAYNRGYDDAQNETYYFNLGYKDAQDGKSPRYPSNNMYMEGYGEGQ